MENTPALVLKTNEAANGGPERWVKERWSGDGKTPLLKSSGARTQANPRAFRDPPLQSPRPQSWFIEEDYTPIVSGYASPLSSSLTLVY
ncbi:hypothetical protein EYR38_010358 [Pleurotus pulmonarius]|nr:hypothetical protein EYR38_010358 [Pleurotus pulmonarius]